MPLSGNPPVAAPVTPGGSSGQLQWNSSGAFAGISGTSVSGANVTWGGTHNVPRGALGAVAIGFGGSTNEGIYSAAAGFVGMVSGGALVAGMDAGAAWVLYNGKYLGFDSGIGSGDVRVQRVAAGILKVTDSTGSGAGAVVLNPVAVASLPSAATAGVGARAFVNNATGTMAANHGATVVGGGSNKVPVYSDGTNWIIG